MILFPNAKINLGLNVVRRREDNYHELDMVMAPVGWCDILELTPSRDGQNRLVTSGRPVDCPPEKNLVTKARRLLDEAIGATLPPVDIRLHKIIPDGAGLGGGSSDAAFTLRGLNSLFGLGLSDERLAEIALKVGADCPFFIYNLPMACRGIGEILCDVTLTATDGLGVVIAKPRRTSVSTAEAYGGILPVKADESPADIIAGDISGWSGRLVNDFERTIFVAHPEIGRLKEFFARNGALYTSMSGSGAAVYAICQTRAEADRLAERLATGDYFDVWSGDFPYLPTT